MEKKYQEKCDICCFHYLLNRIKIKVVVAARLLGHHARLLATTRALNLAHNTLARLDEFVDAARLLHVTYSLLVHLDAGSVWDVLLTLEG